MADNTVNSDYTMPDVMAGWFTVLRFWDDEVLKQVENVKQAIWEALGVPSSILPRGGGEED